MNFNSLEFWIFFLFVLLGVAVTMPYRTARNVFLLVASYLFYASWNWAYSGLMFGVTLIGYLICLGMEKTKGRKRVLLLIVGLIFSFSILGLFKYFNFFVDSSNILLDVFGLNAWNSRVTLLLPIGISFYTFEIVSYIIDVYYEKIPAEKSFIRFAAFISFFPHLVAGPIVRASDFLPQLSRPTHLNHEWVLGGLALAFRGLVKKVLIADSLALFGVDAVFKNPGMYSTFTLWMALYGYAIQIYCDFSGYSDIAIGTARIIGFDLAQNFDRPYQARTPSEFWKRWHISLSTFLRDYLYIPLGGNRGRPFKIYRNLMLTMILCGLWHGAAWNFVLWGFYQGLLLIIGRLYWPFGKGESRISKALGTFFTFQVICLGWLLFRASDSKVFKTYFSGLLEFRAGEMPTAPFLFVLILGLVVHYFPQVRIDTMQSQFIRFPVTVQAVCYLAMTLIFVGVSQQTASFIYFQF